MKRGNLKLIVKDFPNITEIEEQKCKVEILIHNSHSSGYLKIQNSLNLAERSLFYQNKLSNIF